MTTNELTIKIMCCKRPEAHKKAAMKVIMDATYSALGRRCPECESQGEISENGEGDYFCMECEHMWSGDEVTIDVDEVQDALNGKW